MRRFLHSFITGLLLVGASRLAAESLNSATVSRVENQVSYGKVIGDKSETRPAVTNDVIQSKNFLLSETNSRAELRYEDGTIVRIGQNTIFTFEANNRIFDLRKGTFVFYVPKGKGGGTIKTQSFTAAITGTIGKVSDNIIACIEGEITLEPSGMKIPAGFFAQKDEFGVIQIKPFDASKEYDGKLMTFNGPLPEIPESGFGSFISLLSDLGLLESQSRTSNLPSGIFRFNPTPTPGPTAPPNVQTNQPTATPVAAPVYVPSSTPPPNPPLEFLID